MQWAIKTRKPKPYWSWGFALLPHQAKARPGLHVWVWLEPIGVHTEMWGCPGGCGEITEYCTRSCRIQENNALVN